MKYGNLNSVRCKSFIVVFLSLIVFGCAHGNNGAIHVSQPKVWREDAIMVSKGRQIAALRKFESTAKLSAVQGERIRSSEAVTTFSIGSDAKLPDTPGTVPSGQPNTDKAEGAKPTSEKDNKSNTTIYEEPLDALQRVNDFYATFEGTVLEHLRDTYSQSPGFSLYLLGFDISVSPGPATRADYDGYLKFEIKGGSKDNIQVYAVSPERYAKRFSEIFGLKRKFSAALKAAVKQYPLSIGHARKFSDELSTIERYPIVSGFIEGAHTFGWIFHSQPRIAKSGKKIEYSLESGIRHCYAYVLVKDGSIPAPKWFFTVDNREFQNRINKFDKFDKNEAWFKALHETYKEIINNVKSPGAEKELKYIKEHLFEGAFGFSYSDTFKPEELKAEIEKWRKEAGIGETDDIEELIEEVSFELKELEKANEKSSKDYRDKVIEKKKLENFGKPFKKLHTTILGLVGRHGKTEGKTESAPPITDLEIIVTGRWIKNSGGHKSFVDPFSGEDKLQTPLYVTLPDKVDRTLDAIWAVWPEEAPENEEIWVSIKGRGFTNEPKVFMGSQKAVEVLVISRRTILARFPRYSIRDRDNESECHMVKVYSGGEAMVSPWNAFCYKRLPKPKPTKVFSVTKIHPQEAKGKQKIEIKANMGVLDKVKKVVIGGMDIVPVAKNLNDQKDTIKIALPELPKGKSAGFVEIRLHFKEDTNIVPCNIYIVPYWFKHLK